MGLTVLVTGGGGPAGVAVIRSLRSSGNRVVAVDAHPSAVGLRLADDFAVVPRADEGSLVEALCVVAERTGAEALVSTVAEEMGVLDAGSAALEEAGLALWLPSAQAVDTCVDKWHFAKSVAAAGLPAPATGLGSAAGVPGPWIVKPRFGRGSRDVYAVDDPAELAWALRRVAEPLAQTRLDGREFSVDALVGRDGVLEGAVPRWRVEVKAGISTQGLTFDDPALVALVADLLTAVDLRGAANVQGFVDAGGSATFVEINPRFSGGLPLALAAGADLVGEYVRAVTGSPIRRERLAYRAGVTMLRHFEEVFEG